MAVFAVFIPVALLAVLVALGRYEELVLPPLGDEPDAADDTSGADGGEA